MEISWIDLTIVVAYLLGITGIGVFVGRRQSDTSAGYFLASRSLGWTTVGLALFATNISTVHLIGLASSGFSDGMVVGNFEWMAPFLLILLGLVFAPFYFRTKISTLPEYLEGRYGPGSRTVLAIMAVIGLRKNEPDLARPFKTPWYPWPIIIAALLNTVLLVIFIAQDPWYSLSGFIAVGAVWVLYVFVFKRKAVLEPIEEGT